MKPKKDFLFVYTFFFRTSFMQIRLGQFRIQPLIDDTCSVLPRATSLNFHFQSLCTMDAKNFHLRHVSIYPL